MKSLSKWIWNKHKHETSGHCCCRRPTLLQTKWACTAKKNEVRDQPGRAKQNHLAWEIWRLKEAPEIIFSTPAQSRILVTMLYKRFKGFNANSRKQHFDDVTEFPNRLGSSIWNSTPVLDNPMKPSSPTPQLDCTRIPLSIACTDESAHPQSKSSVNAPSYKFVSSLDVWTRFGSRPSGCIRLGTFSQAVEYL